ncbi:MAG: uncharacterized protein H6Q77_960 [Gemmatimonadetes bacterium]|jgi:hypothetical protein|nr:uncharacterized protein [Gemmatimonadota bacterium]
MKRRSGLTWAAVRKIGLSFPGVEEATSYGTPSLHVRKKFLARLREDGESLVIKCGFDERDFRLQADPVTFFVTDHYRGYPALLVRLSEATPTLLREVLEEAWRVNAPKRLVKEYDAR